MRKRRSIDQLCEQKPYLNVLDTASEGIALFVVEEEIESDYSQIYSSELIPEILRLRRRWVYQENWELHHLVLGKNILKRLSSLMVSEHLKKIDKLSWASISCFRNSSPKWWCSTNALFFQPFPHFRASNFVRHSFQKATDKSLDSK